MRLEVQAPHWFIWGELIGTLFCSFVPLFITAEVLIRLLRNPRSTLFKAGLFFTICIIYLPIPLALPLTTQPRYFFSGVCFLTALKCFEMIRGSVPDSCILHDRESAWVFLAVPGEIKYHAAKPIRQQDRLGIVSLVRSGRLRAGSAIHHLVILGSKLLLISLLTPPLQGGGWHLADRSPLVNHYALTWFIFLSVSLYVNLLNFGLALLGYESIEVFKNPLLESVNPRDFWSRRWNMIIHGHLRRTIFPLLLNTTNKQTANHNYYYKMAQNFLAALLGFGVSAIFHEYLCLAAFYPYHHQGPALWLNLKFFILQSFITSAEMILRPICMNMLGLKDSDIPAPFRVIFTTLLLMPTVPWFADPLIRGGLLDGIADMMPKLIVHT